MRKKLVDFIRAITFGGADYARYLLRKVVVGGKVRRVLGQKEVKLEIGAGRKKGVNGWITLDLGGADLTWDLRNGVPFPDSSVDKIYSSHLFEHLAFPHVQQLMKECVRVLKDNGEFSICVPNARLYIESYIKKDYTFWNSKPDFWAPAYHNTTTPIDFINYVAYLDDEHKYMYDEENLLWILKTSGLSNVRLRQFEPGLDDKKRDHESLYATGTKGAAGK